MDLNKSVMKIVDKSLGGKRLTIAEIEYLLGLDLDSSENYLVMAAANRITREMAGDQGMISGQVGLNVDLCSKNCEFCSFANKHGLIKEGYELSPEKLITKVEDFLAAGVNYISLMTTADYPFEKFMKMSEIARKHMPPEMMLSANIGDFARKEAVDLKKVGYGRVYHALRLGEGTYTEINPQDRVRTIEAAAAENLEIGFCIEPIGPEHSINEIASQIDLSLEFNPTMIAVMRRVPIKGTAYGDAGIVSARKMAQIMALTRLAYAFTDTKTFYIHEPSMLGLAAGANLLCAEICANPREINESSDNGRGYSVEKCREMLSDAGYDQRLQSNYPGSWFEPC